MGTPSGGVRKSVQNSGRRWRSCRISARLSLASRCRQVFGALAMGLDAPSRLLPDGLGRGLDAERATQAADLAGDVRDLLQVAGLRERHDRVHRVLGVLAG